MAAVALAAGVHVMAGYVGRLWAALPRPWTQATWGYVARSVMAATLALWLGFQLHLDSPFSAASTVLLLIHPLQGAVIGKGFMRVVGTALGLLAAVILLGLFAQKMLLFILGIGVWLGLCVAGMTLLRHYHATAAVVAGYTVCLALGPAIVAPQQGFDHLVTRGTAVVLGVLSLSLVASLFGRKTVERRLGPMLKDVSSRALRLLASQSKGEGVAAAERRQLALDIVKVDDLLGIGRGESVLIRSRFATLQAGLAYLQAVALQHLSVSTPVVGVAEALQKLAETDADFSTTAARIRALQDGLDEESVQLSDPLADLSNALQNFACLEHDTPAPARAVGFHRHYGDALLNGLRALVATLATAAVWYFTAWDQGPTLLAVLGPSCTLLATSPTPTKGLAGLFRGTIYGIVAAAACKFLLLPHISGFALLAVVLIAFWVWGMQATTQPRHALQAIAYLIAFNTLVGTGGTAQYDFTDFANQALAWPVALAICMLAFQILPRNPAAQVRALKRALHTSTGRLLRGGARMDLLKWQARQQHRMGSLQALPGGEGEAVGALSLQLSRSLGRVYARTRELAPGTPVARCAQRGIRRLSRHAFEPGLNALQARRTAQGLRLLGAGELARCYQEVAQLLGAYAASGGQSS